MQTDELNTVILNALDDLKAKDVKVIDVRDLTGVTDFMVIASGTSNRHVKSLAQKTALDVKKTGFSVLGIEGESEAEWILVDFGDVLLHVMLPETRDFYALEKLWSVAPVRNLEHKS